MSAQTIDVSVRRAFESDPVLAKFLENVLRRPFDEEHRRPLFVVHLTSFALAVLSEQREVLTQWCVVVGSFHPFQDLYDFQEQFMEMRMRDFPGDQYDDAMARARHIVERLEVATACRRITSFRAQAYGFHSCVSSAARALCMLKVAPSDSCYPARLKLRGLEFERKLPLDAVLDCVQRLPVTVPWDVERRFAKAVHDDSTRPCLRECILTFACSPSELVDAWPEIGSLAARTRARLVQWLKVGPRLTAQEFTRLLLELLKVT